MKFNVKKCNKYLITTPVLYDFWILSYFLYLLNSLEHIYHHQVSCVNVQYQPLHKNRQHNRNNLIKIDLTINNNASIEKSSVYPTMKYFFVYFSILTMIIMMACGQRSKLYFRCLCQVLHNAKLSKNLNRKRKCDKNC